MTLKSYASTTKPVTSFLLLEGHTAVGEAMHMQSQPF